MYEIKWTNAAAATVATQVVSQAEAVKKMSALLSDTGNSVTVSFVQVKRDDAFDNKVMGEYIAAITGELALEREQQRYSLRDLLILQLNVCAWQSLVGFMIDGYHTGRDPVTEPLTAQEQPSLATLDFFCDTPKHGEIASTHAIAAKFGSIVDNSGAVRKWREFETDGGKWLPIYNEHDLTVKQYRFNAWGAGEK